MTRAEFEAAHQGHALTPLNGIVCVRWAGGGGATAVAGLTCRSCWDSWAGDHWREAYRRNPAGFERTVWVAGEPPGQLPLPG